MASMKIPQPAPRKIPDSNNAHKKGDAIIQDEREIQHMLENFVVN